MKKGLQIRAVAIIGSTSRSIMSNRLGMIPFISEDGEGYLVKSMIRLLQSGILFVGKHQVLYPWRYFDPSVNIPINDFILMLRYEMGLRVKKGEILNLRGLNLLPGVSGEGFPLFALDRVSLIRDCQMRYGYSDSQMKQLMSYEDIFIEHESNQKQKSSYDEYEYFNINARKLQQRLDIPILKMGKDKVTKAKSETLEYHVKNLTKRFLHTKHDDFLKHDEIQDLKPKTDIKDFLEGQTNFAKLSNKDKGNVRFMAEHQIAYEESSKFTLLEEYRLKLLYGYSPQIAFRSPIFTETWDLGDAEKYIDWKESINNANSLELDFLRTPMFKIERKKDKIKINVFKTNAVDSGVMRQIGCIYSIFRKQLGVKRRGWGELSGTKAELARRDRELQKHFKKLRFSVPASGIAFEKLQEWMQGKWGPLSIERLQRIVYGKN